MSEILRPVPAGLLEPKTRNPHLERLSPWHALNASPSPPNSERESASGQETARGRESAHERDEKAYGQGGERHAGDPAALLAVRLTANPPVLPGRARAHTGASPPSLLLSGLESSDIKVYEP